MFESPQSEEKTEEADVAGALKRHPCHEEDLQTLLLFAATMKQFSKETPAAERPKLAVGASSTLVACKGRGDMRAMSYSEGEWAGFLLALCSLSQCARHTHVKRGEGGMPLPNKMKFGTGVKKRLQTTSSAAKKELRPPRDQ